MLSSLPWLGRYLRLFPQVDAGLQNLTVIARQITDSLLQSQALLSLENKAFHCYGGAVMALLAPPRQQQELVQLIIYLQTISDYLDNLCDRAGKADAQAFLALHQALQDAVNPEAKAADYYANYGNTEDEYLKFLVVNSQAICRRLPCLSRVRLPLQQLITYYSYLQAYKHMPLAEREGHLQTCLSQQVPNPSQLSWWELAAATGSTLGMFALLAMASHHELEQQDIDSVLEAYFPWICGLHILLDYLIDREEDIEGGDLNFVSYYNDLATAWQSLQHFVVEAKTRASQLPLPSFHILVVTGLLAMYMSDHKVQLQGALSQAKTLIRSAGRGSMAIFHLCRLTRRLKGVK